MGSARTAQKQDVLEAALKFDSTDKALLQKDTVYQVRITYDGKRSETGPPDDTMAATEGNQSFWFKTDELPPTRLDPWVLVGIPGEGEKHYFAFEPIKVVFATKNPDLIFATYGKKLQARLKPASFRPVPTDKSPHPLPLNELISVKTEIVTPWENALGTVALGFPEGCVSIHDSSTSMQQIDIHLDLFTDYVLDIEMVDISSPDGTPGDRVWRQSFSTGGFRTLEEFANSFQIARVAHRGVHIDDKGKLQKIRTQTFGGQPQGFELDEALIGAGLDPQPVADFPVP